MRIGKKKMGFYHPQPRHPATGRSMPIENFFFQTEQGSIQVLLVRGPLVELRR